ncbi:MAG: cobalt transporter, partial [Lentisphaeria bacterium]|nr:cobalt transporter [Lentisphaeria bacterium]
DMEIEPNGADTVGGYVMERLGRLPRAGDVAEDERYLFRIVKMTGRRVAAVRIEPRKTGREET